MKEKGGDAIVMGLKFALLLIPLIIGNFWGLNIP